MLDSLQLIFTFCFKRGMLCSFKGEEEVSVTHAVKERSVNKEDVAHIKAQFLRAPQVVPKKTRVECLFLLLQTLNNEIVVTSTPLRIVLFELQCYE